MLRTVSVGSVLTSVVFFSPGCCSDTEADSVFKMTDNSQNISYRRSVSITPKASTPFNQFLPTKDKPSGYVPAPLRKKRAERNEDNRHSWASGSTEEDHTLTRYWENTHNGKTLEPVCPFSPSIFKHERKMVQSTTIAAPNGCVFTPKFIDLSQRGWCVCV